MTLPHVDDFLLHIQVNNYSKETIYNYERDLKVFKIFLTDDVTLKNFQKLTKHHIELYKAYLTSEDRKTSESQKSQKLLSAGSVNRYLSSLRRYLDYLIEMDHKTPIVPQNIKLVKMPKKVSKVADLHDLKRLIESPTEFEKNRKVALRNRAMLELIFSTGMRISELVGLKRSQIDNQGRIFVMGKGKKERFVYLTNRAQKYLKDYLKIRTDDRVPLFIPYSGQNMKDKNAHISDVYLQTKIKEYRDFLNINVPTSAHSFRHGFATYLAEGGANPAAIQILLGHESLDTTTRYVHASDHFAADQHKKFHPLGKE